MKKLVLITLLSIVSLSTLGVEMDARLNMAIRLLNEIDNGLSSLRVGDVSTYNTLSKKLTKAADMLKSSESNQHPDFVPSTQRWNSIRQAMVDTAAQWQSQQQNNATANQNNQTSQQSNAAPTASQSTNQAQPSSIAKYTVDTDAILARYHPDNLPKLADKPSNQQLEQWAASLAALQGEQLSADIEALDSDNANPDDADRVKRWITGNFQQQINSQIKQRIDQTGGSIRDAELLANMILDIPDDDEMRIYNFANGDNGLANQERLDAGMQASTQLALLGKWFPTAVDSSLLQAADAISAASQRFAQMRREASQTDDKLAAMPKKQRLKRPDFLGSIEQEIWLNGRYIGSLSTKGTVYIESNDVGSITADGRIWVRGDDAGSIETNGEVWLRGTQLGSLEDNGEVWRNGTQIGLVEIDGDGAVWIGGSKDGKIEPYDGEWKRAAIVYFFRDVFDDAF